MNFSRIEEAVAAMKEGRPVVVADHPGRENEGDLIVAAEKITPELVAFIVRHTSGIICVSLLPDRLEQLRLPLMVPDNAEAHRTAFTVSVDWKHGTTTGVSAADRSATIRALADPGVVAEGFVRPGHIFPLRCEPAGVLARPGHTEAAVDLARLAGLFPAGVLCEIVNDDGSMAQGEQREDFARRHHLPYITIPELVAYRRSRERLVTKTATARLPTRHGVFTTHVYRSILDGAEHVALVKGEVNGRENVLVRVHSECVTGDVLGSLRCDCGQQLENALARVAREETGVVLYLRNHEGRGIGLTDKLRAYALQDEGLDTVQANVKLGLPVDARSYDVGAQILTDLGLTTIRLMSNNPAKFQGLETYRLKIVERVPLLTTPTCENHSYLRAKQVKLGHLLDLSVAGLDFPKEELVGRS
ncbi:MAG TPA: bifunctional 3,4-dihydroxy-2-butanone-4-phosphate synthase/GTP cyclohydrolase II [Opitutaceae bacterium]|jgi:3,4-dihydroxy 2-butanone 4-phosphate synthase/GTP cyclohydrolase II|nr:bifunctional 3,4-dihydroxy-2-butanone-4-phosphate synthase/GTP cyclohydrolase II [Opitutaceae bacterium]